MSTVSLTHPYPTNQIVCQISSLVALPSGPFHPGASCEACDPTSPVPQGVTREAPPPPTRGAAPSTTHGATASSDAAHHLPRARSRPPPTRRAARLRAATRRCPGRDACLRTPPPSSAPTVPSSASNAAGTEGTRPGCGKWRALLSTVASSSRGGAGQWKRLQRRGPCSTRRLQPYLSRARRLAAASHFAVLVLVPSGHKVKKKQRITKQHIEQFIAFSLS